MTKNIPWGATEKLVLQENYVQLGASACADMLPGRSREKIRAMASYLGLSKTEPLSERDRFQSKFRVTPGCWIWVSGADEFGYGRFGAKGKTWRAHRYSFALYVGSLQDDMSVCHRCDTPSCVNPDHLFLGTNQDNVLDRVTKGRSARQLGPQNKASHLTEQDVHAIRQAVGSLSQIAARFGTSATNVAVIKKRTSWAHLPEVSP